ncbi:hypothetical protein MLD38_019170 [Melastoma candidum]|uniref:Uncharacterized protein n=1 Tax=Melastoma candidum TaxID=119954 RepID=A0ACB9QW83_9MYRT|nr:hypothetical protein MLD38_019170 [Melastoma candidum]
MTSLSLDVEYYNYRLEKLAFKELGAHSGVHHHQYHRPPLSSSVKETPHSLDGNDNSDVSGRGAGHATSHCGAPKSPFGDLGALSKSTRQTMDVRRLWWRRRDSTPSIGSFRSPGTHGMCPMQLLVIYPLLNFLFRPDVVW